VIAPVQKRNAVPIPGERFQASQRLGDLRRGAGTGAGSGGELARTAADIVDVRNRKFPPAMKCAGSVFKNLLASQLPPPVLAQVPPATIREGKIPAAWFLEQIGAKGMKTGDIHVADYHANLLYNEAGALPVNCAH